MAESRTHNPEIKVRFLSAIFLIGKMITCFHSSMVECKFWKFVIPVQPRVRAFDIYFPNDGNEEMASSLVLNTSALRRLGSIPSIVVRRSSFVVRCSSLAAIVQWLVHSPSKRGIWVQFSMVAYPLSIDGSERWTFRSFEMIRILHHRFDSCYCRFQTVSIV